jgi:hypothetical protein
MSDKSQALDIASLVANAISQPLVKHVFTADPSAHVFDGRIYIYPSHDIEGNIAFNDNGDHFCMRDYHVFSMQSPTSEVVDHGVALDVKDVAWAEKQLWAPDIARKGDRFYFYFPARAYDGRFKIGVAVGTTAHGPFQPQPEAMAGSYSIDPAVLADDDGHYYLYWGGLWGGQLQKYRNNRFAETNDLLADDEPALGPRVARLRDDMLEMAEAPVEISIVDEVGRPLRAGDNSRRYFEGPWLHKYRGLYYLSYSTGDTHTICYATADNPYGPFHYRGRILNPVVGWTTHHSIVELDRRWYLFYHDSTLSNGVTHLRCIKVTELFYNEDGSIRTIDPYRDLQVKG